jgi:hypothetical protein
MRVLVTGKRNADQVVTFERDGLGRFCRIHRHWSLENFNDGYIDADGRFRVYFPGHPRTDKKLGYIFRAIVAYEAYHYSTIENGFDVHHKNENRLDDSIENLELVEHKQHSHFHHPKLLEVIRVCKWCGKIFSIPNWRLKDITRGQYCSQTCYHNSRGKVIP